MSQVIRVNPVYFNYPFESHDEITLELPAGYMLESLPAPQSIDRQAGHYEITGELRGATLHLRRLFKLSGYTFQAAEYPSLRSFFDLVRSTDEQSATLKSSAAASTP